MKKSFVIPIALFVLIACMPLSGLSQEGEGKHQLKSNLSVSINSNGFAPIPAFSLGKPAFIASANIAKGRFSYDPVLAYSLEMKPWFIDNWLHYTVIQKPKFEFKVGTNFSTFFS